MNCIIPSVEWNRGETSLYIKYIEAFYSEEGVTMGFIKNIKEEKDRHILKVLLYN